MFVHLFSGIAATETGLPLTLCGHNGPEHVISTNGTTSCEECALIKAVTKYRKENPNDV